MAAADYGAYRTFLLARPAAFGTAEGMKQCDASPAAPTNVRLTQGVRAAG